MAEAVFRHTISSANRSKAHNFPLVDSCGTGAFHIGNQPDRRTLAVLEKNGIGGFRHSARAVRHQDFQDFDYIMAMDDENLEDLVELKRSIKTRSGRRTKNSRGEPSSSKLASVHLFGEFGGKSKGEEVVDPYYGGGEGFDIAFEQMQRFSQGFLKWLDEGGEKQP